MSTIITPPGIACFPRLFQASVIGKNTQGQEPNYGLVMLFPEPALATDAWNDLRAAMNATAVEKFGADKMADKAFVSRVKENLPVKDAGEKEGEWNGFTTGRKYITMKRKQDFGRPQVIDASGNEIIDDSLIFGGCVVRCGVRFYAWEHSGRVGVSCSLDMVELLRGGSDVKRLDNKLDAKKAFKAAGKPTGEVADVLSAMGVDPAAVSNGNNDSADDDDDDEDGGCV